jgi:ABC-type Fe3+ transport system permease subunit
MYVISECVTCAVVTFTLSAFLFTFCVVLLTIKQQIESRRGTSRVIQRVGMLFRARPATVVARHERFGQ